MASRAEHRKTLLSTARPATLVRTRTAFATELFSCRTSHQMFSLYKYQRIQRIRGATKMRSTNAHFSYMTYYRGQMIDIMVLGTSIVLWHWLIIAAPCAAGIHIQNIYIYNTQMYLVSLQCFDTVSWADRKGIRPVKSSVLVCSWWWFDRNFARLIAPVVTTTSSILSCNKAG